MQLPFFAAAPKNTLATIVIAKCVVASALWHSDGSTVTIDATGEFVSFESENSELSEAVDTSLTSLPKGAKETTQVLLSLPDDWVSGQGIHQRYKPILRHLCETLELSSVGFVVTVEALIAALREESHMPFSAVVLFVEADALLFSIVRQGSATAIMRIGRSGKTVDDILEGCSRLKEHACPFEVVLASLSAGSDEMLQVKSEIETYSWDPSIFQQTPRVRLLEGEAVVRLVTQSGGKEVAKALHVSDLEQPSTAVQVQTATDRFQPVAPVSLQASDDTIDVPGDPPLHQDEKPVWKMRKRPLFIVVGLLVLLSVGGILGAIIFAPRFVQAHVTVTLARSEFQGATTLIVSTQENEDAILGTLVTTTIDASKEVPTTGKKQTGDAATGKVTIYNKTSVPKQFKSGTQLRSGRLLFSTTADVTVASASASISETVHGKASVGIKALAVGEEGNLSKDTDMIVATFDQSAFVARTEGALTGGSKRTIQAVAQKDQDAAVAAALESIRAGAPEKLALQANELQQITLLDGQSIVSKKFTGALGEEATSVGVDITASISGVIYPKGALLLAAQQKLSSTIDAGMQFSPDSTTIKVTGQRQKSPTVVELDVSVETTLEPAVDTTQYGRLLSGKSIPEATRFLDEQQAIANYLLEVRPRFLAPLVRRLPQVVTVSQSHVEK